VAETQKMVAMSHPDIKGSDDAPGMIPERNVEHYKAKGWKVIKTAAAAKKES